MLNEEQLHAWFQSEQVLSGTGHRPQKLNNEFDLEGPYSNFINQQMKEHFELLKPSKIISGMALGFDQLLALFAIERGIPVLAAVPCDNQEKLWPKRSQDRYQQILSNRLVTTYVVCPGPYNPGTMQVRNEWMCDHSNLLLACWDGSSGGTANCIKYARKINMDILYINLQKLTEKKNFQNPLFE